MSMYGFTREKSASSEFRPYGVYYGNVVRVDGNSQVWVKMPRIDPSAEFGPLPTTQPAAVGDTVACMFVENRTDEIVVIGVFRSSEMTTTIPGPVSVTGDLTVTGTVVSSGAISAPSLTLTGSVQAATITTTGAVNAASITTGGSVSAASVTVTGNLTAATLAGNGANVTGLNAGALSSGTVPAARLPAFSGDAATTAGSTVLTLATVNTNVGSWGGASSVSTFTVDGKGRITAANSVPVVAPAGTLSGSTLASGVTASSLTSVGTLTALTVSGTATLTGGLVTNGTLSLSNGTSNLISFNTAGVAAPTFTTRSAGTKLVLYPAVAGAAVDYALGIDGNTLWSSVPTTGDQFKWYAGTTTVMTVNGTGSLSVASLAVSSGNLTSASSTVNLFSTASTINIGSNAGTAVFGNDMIVNGDLIVSGTTTTTNSTTLSGGSVFTADTIGTVPITVGAFTGQVANLTEWKTSTGTVLSAIDTTGKFTGVATNATKLETARTIAGKTFDGTQNVTLSALTRGTYLTGSNFDGSTATTWSVDATTTNTASKIVARDVNGDFAARIITASLTGNASTASQWLTARTITLGTDLSGSVSISGSGDVTLNATITPTTGTGNFVRAVSPTLTGVPILSASGAAMMQFKASGTTDHGYLEFYVDTDALTTRSGYFGWGAAGSNHMTVANQMTNGHLNLITNGTGVIQANGNTIWHAANDGAGSTLDSDLLDGQHGAYYRDWTNVTNKPSPVITLGEDASGSVTLTNVGSATLNVTVLDDSHLHDGRYYTETEADARFINAAGDTITGVLASTVATGTAPFTLASTTLVVNLNSDLLDGQHGAWYQDWANTTNKPSPTITLGNHATGSVTLTDLGSGTLNVTIVNDSHTHDGRYYTETEADTRFVNVSGDTITGVLTSTVTTGTAPFAVASTTAVTNLNADLLDGQHGSWYSDWANITNKPDPVVSLSGDVHGTATMTDLGSITIGTTIQPNSVALGTDTTGQYARTLAGTPNRITVTTPNADDGTDYVLTLPQDVHTAASPQFASTRLINTTNSTVVLSVQGEASQTADLQQWKNPTTTLARVDTVGRASFPEVFVDTSTPTSTRRIGMLAGESGNPSRLYIVADPSNANTTPAHASVTTPFYADSNGRFSIGDSLFFDPSDGQTFGRLTVIGRIRGAIENTPIVPTDSGQFTVDQVVISGTTPNQTAVLRTTAQHTFNVGDTVVVADLAGNAAAANGAWAITAKTTVSPFTFTVGGLSGATNGTYSATGTARVREMTFGLHPAIGTSPAGLGIRLDESNYWFVNNRFRVGSTGSSMVWDGSSLTLTGRVVAQSGDFQGALTVNNGSMKIGKDASGGGADGIFISAGNYWYSTGAFNVGGTNGIAYTGASNITIGSSVQISGVLTANLGGVIGGFTIASGQLTAGSGVGVGSTGVGVSSGTTSFWAGDTVATNAKFRVTNTGALTATNATITGGITASTLSVGGANGITYTGIGPVTIGTGVTISGELSSITGSIGGFTIGPSQLSALSGQVGISSGATSFWAGSATPTSAPFYVSSAGALTATSATITGVITATSGTFTGTINAASGNFTGAMTVNGGVMKVGASAGGTGLHGIYIGAGNFWYDSGQFQIGGTNGVSYTPGGSFQIGSAVQVNGSAIVNGSITGTSINVGAGTFTVSSAGALTATNATITGSVTATSGTFNGTINAAGGTFVGAVTVAGTMKIGVDAGGTGLNGLFISTGNHWYSDGRFNVGGANGIAYTGTGNVTIGTDVTVRGAISIASGAFSVTTAGFVTASAGTIGGWTLAANSLTGGGTTLNSNGSIAAGTNFSVSTTGVVTASNAVISGTLTASAGTIGGWTLGASALSGGTTTLNSNGSIAAGTNFSVSTTGVLTASNAVISGAITANSGTIGGWTLSGNTLAGGTTTLNSNGSIAAGTNFSVSTTGVLTASNAVLSGSITSSSGTIGGFTIGASQLSAGGGSVGISTGATSFWAGSATPTSAAFNVSSTGVLTASGAVITGSVTADTFLLRRSTNTVSTLGSVTISNLITGTNANGARLTLHHLTSGATDSYLGWTADAGAGLPSVVLYGPGAAAVGADRIPYLHMTTNTAAGASQGFSRVRLQAPRGLNGIAVLDFDPDIGTSLTDSKPGSVGAQLYMNSTGVLPLTYTRDARGQGGITLEYYAFGSLNIRDAFTMLGVEDNPTVGAPLNVQSWLRFNRAPSWTSELTSSGALTISSASASIASTVATGQTHSWAVAGITRLSISGSGAAVTGTLGVSGLATLANGATVTGTVAATTFSGSGASLTSIPNSATTATSANTLNAIVARDGSGGFTAGIITASAATVSGNITFPDGTSVGIQNTAGSSYLHLDRAGGNSLWKTKPTATALIDADTTTFRLSGGGTTVGTFNSSGFSVGATAATGIGLKKRSTDSVMLLSYGQSDNYVLATNGGGSSFLRCGASSATIFVVGATSVAQFAPNGDFHPIPDNTYKLGWSEGRWSAVWSATATIQTSDARTKTDVINSPLGLSFINRLRPVQYRYIVGSNVVVDNVYNPETGGNDPITEPVPGVRLHAGLIAQEVKQALDAEEAEDFGGWLLTDKDDPDSEQALRYEEFIAPLIRAVQELSAEVATLKAALLS